MATWSVIQVLTWGVIRVSVRLTTAQWSSGRWPSGRGLLVHGTLLRLGETEQLAVSGPMARSGDHEHGKPLTHSGDGYFDQFGAHLRAADKSENTIAKYLTDLQLSDAGSPTCMMSP